MCWGLNRFSSVLDLNKALILDPDYAQAYYDRGVAYLNKHDLDRAMSDFVKVSGLKADLPRLHYSLAVLYYYKANYVAARISLRRAILSGCTIDPKFVEDLKKASYKTN